MIVFVRSYTAEHDSRINKYFRTLDALGLHRVFIGWRRDGTNTAVDDENIFCAPTPLGRRWSNLFNFIRWNIFVFYRLCLQRRSVRAVHCVDLDSALPAYIYCLIFRRHFIFDLYDNFSSSRHVVGIAASIMDGMETIFARRAALAIVAAPERIVQHRLDPAAGNVLVLENVPVNDLAPINLPPCDGVLRLGYFGVLERKHRGLEELIDLARTCDRVEIVIAGYGPLASQVAEAASVLPNLSYHGPQSSADGLRLMQTVHVIVGLYYLSNSNHLFAAPNKYYEHLMLGRGLLTTRGTPPGRRAVASGTGWAIDDGIDALREWAESVRSQDVIDAASKARDKWAQEYCDYYEKTYIGEYGRRVSSLSL